MPRNKFDNPALQTVLNGPAPTTAQEVATRLAEIQGELGGFDDAGPLASFNFLYHRITQEIADGVANSQMAVTAGATTITSALTVQSAPPAEGAEGSSSHPLAGHFERSVELAQTLEFEPLPGELADDIEAWLASDAASRSRRRRLFDDDEAFRASVTEEVERIRSGTRPSYLQAIADQVAEGLHFEDPDAMDVLDVQFATLYFEALKAWDIDEPVAESWAGLFEHWDDAGEGPVIGALLGVNAHINHDLAIAVDRAHGPSTAPTDGTARHRDYLAINGIFEMQIPLLLDILIGRVTDLRVWLYLVAVATGKVDDVIEWLVIEARAIAWDHAKLIHAGTVAVSVGPPPIDSVNDPIAGLYARAIRVSPF